MSNAVEKKLKELERKKREREKRKARSTKIVKSSPRKPRRKRRTSRTSTASATLRKIPRNYDEAKALYGTPWYADWREYILKRDCFQCQMCGRLGGKLEVHHIRPKYLFPEKTLDVKNGITLCKSCHQDRVTRHESKFYFIFDRMVALNSRS
jgi:hypothetical protein